MTDKQDQLELEFKALVDTVGQEIKAKVEMAERLLQEAVELADRHGIPFYPSISELGQPYVPPAFKERFGSLDKEAVAELVDMSEYNLGHVGWRRSQLC
jgi:hypothetical protein